MTLSRLQDFAYIPELIETGLAEPIAPEHIKRNDVLIGVIQLGTQLQIFCLMTYQGSSQPDPDILYFSKLVSEIDANNLSEIAKILDEKAKAFDKLSSEPSIKVQLFPRSEINLGEDPNELLAKLVSHFSAFPVYFDQLYRLIPEHERKETSPIVWGVKGGDA